MSFTITMSQKELHRLEVIQKIRDRRLSIVQADFKKWFHPSGYVFDRKE